MLKDIGLKLCFFVLGIIHLPWKIWRRKEFKPHKAKGILVLSMYSGLGNIIMLTPFLKSVKRSMPWIHLAVLVGNSTAGEVMGRLYFVDEILIFNAPGKKIREGIRFFIKEITPRGFDLAILPFVESAGHSSLWTFMARIPYRISYNKGIYGFLDTFTLKPEYGVHEVEQNLKIASFLGADTMNRELSLYPDRDDLLFARDYFFRKELSCLDRVIGIHPGANNGLIEKRWPIQKFAELADRLSAESGARVIFFVGPDDGSLMEKLKEFSKYKHLYVHGRNIHEVAALIRRCRLFISNDSGLMHVACAMRVPVVSLFGPTLPWKNSPWGVKHVLIRKELRCSPCYRRPPINCQDVRCMKLIETDGVFKAVESMLSDIRGKRVC